MKWLLLSSFQRWFCLIFELCHLFLSWNFWKLSKYFWIYQFSKSNYNLSWIDKFWNILSSTSSFVFIIYVIVFWNPILFTSIFVDWVNSISLVDDSYSVSLEIHRIYDHFIGKFGLLSIMQKALSICVTVLLAS